MVSATKIQKLDDFVTAVIFVRPGYFISVEKKTSENKIQKLK
jgi:hypothetical protein